VGAAVTPTVGGGVMATATGTTTVGVGVPSSVRRMEAVGPSALGDGGARGGTAAL
jgi:hypothetical protein